MDIVEVTARIGDSTIALVHLEPGQSFTIGRDPGCDLAVPGIGRFPLVEGDLVRIPAGVRASVDGALRAGEEPIEVALGLAIVTIRKLARAPVPVPRPPRDLRMPAFLLASLIAQVALWAAAAIVAPYSAPPKKPRLLPMHVEHPAPPPAPKPKPEKPQARVQTEKKTGSGQEHAHPRTRGGAGPSEDGFVALAKFANGLKTPVVELDGTGHGPEDYEDHYFGNTRRFDPDSNPAYDTAKVTRFAVPTAGKGVGETLPPPRLVFCDDDSCEARGPIALQAFVAELERHRKQIQDCYVDHTDSAEGTIRLHFGIGTDGKPFSTQLQLSKDHANAKKTVVFGTGIGTVGRCVGKILDKVPWPKQSSETEVWLGIAFFYQPSEPEQASRSP